MTSSQVPAQENVASVWGLAKAPGTVRPAEKVRKGQKSRSGVSLLAGFEGGQMPLHRRLPKVGFRSRKQILKTNQFKAVQLAKLLELGLDEMTFDVLVEKGIARGRKHKVKVLGPAEISKKSNCGGACLFRFCS